MNNNINYTHRISKHILRHPHHVSQREEISLRSQFHNDLDLHITITNTTFP